MMELWEPYMLSVILAAATSIQWLWVAGVVRASDN